MKHLALALAMAGLLSAAVAAPPKPGPKMVEAARITAVAPN